jgi:hypothetical protein
MEGNEVMGDLDKKLLELKECMETIRGEKRDIKLIYDTCFGANIEIIGVLDLGKYLPNTGIFLLKKDSSLTYDKHTCRLHSNDFPNDIKATCTEALYNKILEMRRTNKCIDL